MLRLPSVLIKAALLLLYLLANGDAVMARFASLGLSGGLFIFLGLYLMLVAGLGVAALIQARAVRWAMAGVFFASAVFLGASERVLEDHLTYDLFVTLLGSGAFARDALAEHGARILLETLLALPLLLGIGLAPQGAGVRRRVAGIHVPLGAGWVGVPLAALAVLTALLFVRGGDGARGLPGAYTPLAYLALATRDELAERGPRAPVTLTPAPVAGTGDLVLIVDESIYARYLDVVDPSGVRTGLLTPAAGIAMHNFGIAASITNCSYGSNLTLRHGGTRQTYAQMARRGPAIWDYARAAGFTPVYIDAQTREGQLQNGMDHAEKARIDRVIQLDAVAVENRDHAVADHLAQFMGNGRREFILVNKVGAHFPVHDKYPDSHAHYAPALPRGRFLGISDTGNRDGFDGGAEQWQRYRNAYRNTLLWSVGGFFDRLLAPGTLHGGTVIYTADHGQMLHETDSEGVHTHCSAVPTDAEGAVPLLVLTDRAASGAWPQAAARNRDSASHYQLFPTLLIAMGYDRADVRTSHGDGLDAKLVDELRYNTRYNARLGRQPEWRRIDAQALPRPPESDYATAPGR